MARFRSVLLLSCAPLTACASLVDPLSMGPTFEVLERPDVVVEGAIPIRNGETTFRGAFFGRVPMESSARVLEVELRLWTDLDGDGEHDADEALTTMLYSRSEGLRSFRQPYVVEVEPPIPLAGVLRTTTTEGTHEVPLRFPTVEGDVQGE